MTLTRITVVDDKITTRSTAHSSHKQTRLCTSAPTKAVSGHAFIASAQVNPRAIHVKISLPLAPLMVGAEVIVAEAHSDALWR